MRHADLHAERSAHVLFQASTIGALLHGSYDGDLTFAELAERGDLGLGTLNGLDGEMIAIDGEFLRADVDGDVTAVGPEEQTPFAVVTRFEPTVEAEIPAGLDHEAILAALDELAPEGEATFAVRLDGRFATVRARSVPRQSPPYRPLGEVIADQHVFELADVEGSMVGFRFPAYVEGIEVAGYHLHFIERRPPPRRPRAGLAQRPASCGRGSTPPPTSTSSCRRRSTSPTPTSPPRPTPRSTPPSTAGKAVAELKSGLRSVDGGTWVSSTPRANATAPQPSLIVLALGLLRLSARPRARDADARPVAEHRPPWSPTASTASTKPRQRRIPRLQGPATGKRQQTRTSRSKILECKASDSPTDRTALLQCRPARPAGPGRSRADGKLVFELVRSEGEGRLRRTSRRHAAVRRSRQRPDLSRDRAGRGRVPKPKSRRSQGALRRRQHPELPPRLRSRADPRRRSRGSPPPMAGGQRQRR